MKTYRFVTETHHAVFAETLEEAVESFNEMKRRGLSPKFNSVNRIEVKGETGEFIPADRPLRGGKSGRTTVKPKYICLRRSLGGQIW
jgi:hypothetical protein